MADEGLYFDPENAASSLFRHKATALTQEIAKKASPFTGPIPGTDYYRDYISDLPEAHLLRRAEIAGETSAMETLADLEDPFTESLMADIIPPVKQADFGDHIRNITNFLFENEMGILGARWDNEGFTWNQENFREQWADEPLWSTLALGSLATIVIPPVAMSLKVGRLGKALGRGFKINDEVIKIAQSKNMIKAEEELITAIAGNQIPKNALFLDDMSSTTRYFQKFRNVTSKADHNLLEVQFLSQLPNGVRGPAFWIAKYGDPEAAELAAKYGDDAVKYLTFGQKEYIFDQVPERLLRKARINTSKYQSTLRLNAKASLAERGVEGVQLTRLDKARLKFNKWFANTHSADTMNWDPETRIVSSIGATISGWNDPTNFGGLLKNVPRENKNLMHHLLHKYSPEYIPVPTSQLDNTTKVWLDKFWDWGVAEQQRRHALGFISDDEFARIPVHFSWSRKGRGPGSRINQARRQQAVVRVARLDANGDILRNIDGTPIEDVAVRFSTVPQLESTALLPRRKEMQEIWDVYQSGQMLDTPEELLLHTVMHDSMLVQNYETVRDIILKGDYTVHVDEMAKKYLNKGKPVPDRYINLADKDVLGESAQRRLTRMIKKSAENDPELLKVLGAGDELPWVRKEIFDELFGESGMIEQSANAASWAEIITTMYKTAKTALNPSTHFQNVLGNIAFMHQAGVDPWKPQLLNAGAEISKGFHEFFTAKQTAMRGGDDALIKFYQKWSQRHIAYGGTKIRFLELIGDEDAIKFSKQGLIDPIPEDSIVMRQLLVEEAFGNVEGWEHLQNIYKRLFNMATQQAKQPKESGQTGIKKAFVELILRMHDPAMGKGELNTAAKAYQRMVTQGFNFATDMYLQEDMIPKLLTFLHFYDEGLSRLGAIQEVGRRLPMYKTVGAVFKRSRREFLPWVTFPAEAARITKNNLLDHPLRMLPWLKAPQILQAGAYEVGFVPPGETPESLEVAAEAVPPWLMVGPAGRGGQAMIIGGERGIRGVSAASGGVAGSLVGGYFGGIPGMVVGAAGGGAGGYALSSALDRDTEHLRATILNWLPHSSVMLQGLMNPDVRIDTLHKSIEMLPVEPFAVYKPLLETFLGRDAWGNEMKSTGLSDSISKTIAAYIGFVSPPWVQKYGFKTTSPDIANYMSDWWVPSAVTAFGAWAGFAGGGLPGAALVGGAAALTSRGIPGVFPSPMNISRMYQDAGLIRDPYSHTLGTASQDIFFNNIGVFKNWRIFPETKLMNEKNLDQTYRDNRTALTRELRYALENVREEGDTWDQQLKKIVKKVKASFDDQYEGDKTRADMAFWNWVRTQSSNMGKHPSLRGISNIDLSRRTLENINLLSEQRRMYAHQELQLLTLEKGRRLAAKMINAQKRRSRGDSIPSFGGGSTPDLFSTNLGPTGLFDL